MSSPRRLFALAALLLSAPAAAWPVDLFVDVAPREETFVRFEGVEWVEVLDPKVATAEAFPSGEVLVSGGEQAAETLVMIYGQGRFSVWKVRVARPAERKAPQAEPSQVLQRCPKPVLEPGRVVARVDSEPCRLALRTFLEQGAVRADQTDLTFELTALQGQLRDLEAGLEALKLSGKVQLRYLGAGLVLEGAVSQEEHRRLLWELFRRSAGRAALEDRLTLPEPARPDGGP